MKIRLIIALCVGMVMVAGLAFAKEDLKISEFKLMTFGGEKFATDPATKKKISKGVVITSAGQTDLVYTGDALKPNEGEDHLAELYMKTALMEIRPGAYQVHHSLAIAFSPARWKVSGQAESGDVEYVFELEKDKLEAIERLGTDEALTTSQSDELTNQGLALFEKYGYSNLTPQFKELFAMKMRQFVWSINRQLPEIVLKLVQKYPEAVKSSAGKK